MRGISRDSAAAGQERLDALLAGGGADPVRVGEDLFGVTAVLAANPGLRRALTDPSRDGAAKAALITRLFAGKVDGGSLDLVAGLVRSRWSRAGDLTDTVESFGVDALLAAAERGGRLDSVEDELFRFARTIAGDQGLRDAVSARTPGAARKAELVRSLLAGRAAPESVRLAVQAASAPRGLRTEQVLEGYVEAAARRRNQVVAHVVAAVPLDTAQRNRLVAVLQRQYGRPIQLNIDIDPQVVGGLRVQVGAEVIDGTVAARIDDARRRLAG
jgi:F-type H+-transporting ATPase subunit delta